MKEKAIYMPAVWFNYTKWMGDVRNVTVGTVLWRKRFYLQKNFCRIKVPSLHEIVYSEDERILTSIENLTGVGGGIVPAVCNGRGDPV